MSPELALKVRLLLKTSFVKDLEKVANLTNTQKQDITLAVADTLFKQADTGLFKRLAGITGIEALLTYFAKGGRDGSSLLHENADAWKDGPSPVNLIGTGAGALGGGIIGHALTSDKDQYGGYKNPRLHALSTGLGALGGGYLGHEL